MPCETLFEINTLIFDEYFRNDDNLSNLYSFMINGNNEFCINITDNNFLSNIISDDDFFEGTPTTDYNCNLASGFKEFSNIVKDTATDIYNLELSDPTDAKHYIPQFSSTIIS